MRGLVVVAIVAAACVLAPRALAQATPPDVVQLANGGMVRGTLVENLPGDHVTIQLATGETRVFPSAEVTYAGAAALTAAVVPPPPPPAPRGVRVHVVGTTEALTLQQVTGSATALGGTGRGFATVQVDQFGPLCTAPCDVELAPGTYALGVSLGQGPARRGDHNLFTLESDTTLSIEYESREGLRIAGWLTFLIGALGGAAIMVGPILAGERDIVPPLVAGGAVVFVSEIVGLALAFLDDHADITELADGVRY